MNDSSLYLFLVLCGGGGLLLLVAAVVSEYLERNLSAPLVYRASEHMLKYFFFVELCNIRIGLQFFFSLFFFHMFHIYFFLWKTTFFGWALENLFIVCVQFFFYFWHSIFVFFFFLLLFISQTREKRTIFLPIFKKIELTYLPRSTFAQYWSCDDQYHRQ